MSTSRAVVSIVAAACVAFGVGFWTGKGNSESSQSTDAGTANLGARPALSALVETDGTSRGAASTAVRVANEVEEILANAIPGEPNQVLVDKMRGALEEPDRYKRAAHWQALLSLIRPEDIASVHQLFPESDAKGQWHHMEFEAYWARRGEVAPEAALDDLKTDGYITGGPHRKNVMNSWAQTDGPGALARALTEESEGERASDLMSGAIAGWATHDWQAATAALMSDIPADERGRIIGDLAWSVVYSGGVEEAQTWFAEFGQNFDTDPGLVNQAYRTLFEAVARGGGDATADFMVDQADKPWFDRAPLDQALAGWSHAGPARVLQMIERLPPDEENLRWIDQAAGNWTNVRENGLGNWLIENPESPIYDRVTATFSRQIRSIDPDAARAWMETIEDQSLQDKVRGIIDSE